MKLTVIKKNGTSEPFNIKKIFIAVNKSAHRVNITFTDEEFSKLDSLITQQVERNTEISVETLHSLVERTLEDINPRVAKSYKDYRNYKKEFVHGVIDDIELQTTRTLTDVDRSNSNSNTRYISTKRTEIAKIFAKEMYQKMQLSLSERQAIKDGFIYIHDLSDMLLPQFNCCLFNVGGLLKNGFTVENVKHREPRDITVAIGQLSDAVMNESAQHFG